MKITYFTVNCDEIKESSGCSPGGFYDGKCFVWYNVPTECPNMCNVCPCKYLLVVYPAAIASQILDF